MAPYRHSLRRCAIALAIGGAALCAIAVPDRALAQTPGGIAEARRLRDGGQFAAAAAALGPWLDSNPGDAGARWFHAQLLYWAGDLARARREYERALGDAPGNDALRVDFARFLMETGSFGDAILALEPVSQGDAGVDAEVLRGTVEYWEGDYSSAAARFRRVLKERPDDTGAADGLAGIRTLTAPWVDVGSSAVDDNQPLRAYALTVEAGLYPTLDLAGGVRAVSARLDPGVGGTAETSIEARAFLRHPAPSGGVGFTLEAGAHKRTRAAASIAVGRAEAAVRLRRGVALRAGVARVAYAATLAALDTLLPVRSLDVRLERAAAPGLAGELALRHDRFPDRNTIVSLSAWTLIPVVRGLRIGYAFGYQDAASSRWTAASPARSGPPTDPEIGLGRYDPYYTPERVNAHTALVELLWTMRGRELRFTAALPLHATEQAPVLIGSGAATTLHLAQRSYSPFSATLGVRVPLDTRVDFRIRAEHRRTAYYETSTLDLGLRVRLR